MAEIKIEQIKGLLEDYHKTFAGLRPKTPPPMAIGATDWNRPATENQARLTYFVMARIESIVNSLSTEVEDGIPRIAINGEVPKKTVCVDADGGETVFVREADVA